ncbi:MAG TPA: glycosyltransferase family 2 protein [Mycobacteriales bacterium]|jgi:cellulose synthase/poly-beta-1,6-N-acetylglucosamine synthase-like glycosyltransferase|nr:glycosyltransferase family 2 protein [Mycobacteriales bacterium]
MLGLFLLGAALLVVIVGRPLFAQHSGDNGDGCGVVRIAPPVATPARRPRTCGFFVLTGLFVFICLRWQHPSPVKAYTDVVGRLARGVDGRAVEVAGYVGVLHPAAQLLGVCYLAALALVIRADLGRRLAVLTQAGLYLALAAVLDAMLILAAVRLTLSPRLVTVVSLVLNLLAAAAIGARVTLTTFALPRRTTVVKIRPRYPWDTVLTVVALVVSGAALVSGYALLAPRDAASASAASAWLPLYGISVAVVVCFLALYLVFLIGPHRPDGGPVENPPPALTVITPAYNEQAGITLTLESIDRAAAHYGGPVRVLVSDDGSTDDTAELAQRALDRFTAASGLVLSHPNTGKAGALNRAVARVDTELLVRLDGDCVLDADALTLAARWFTDPRIGSVGALMMPRLDGSSWFHRMRGIECLFQFGLARQGQEVVDGITVVPGTFTAVRCGPLQALGGFVRGMNGEDSDLTMQLGRLGYRVVLDPRVRCFEDVPTDVGSFLEQRTRWGRAGLHTFARHNPLRSGFAGPRTWLWTLRRPFAWVSAMLGLLGPLYLALLAALQPAYRRGVLTIVQLYLLLGAAYLTVAVALIVRHRCWRLLPWLPTWYAFAFLRRLAMLEALISLPTRPLLRRAALDQHVGDPVPGRHAARRRWSVAMLVALLVVGCSGSRQTPSASRSGAAQGVSGSGTASSPSSPSSPGSPSGSGSGSGVAPLPGSPSGTPGVSTAVAGVGQWIFTHAALQQVITDPAVRQRLSSGRIFEILGASGKTTPGLPVVPTMRFASEAELAVAVAAGLPSIVRAVLYDAESWSFTPTAEQHDPDRYYAAAAAVAHAHGLLLIAAPGLDLVVNRCGEPCGPRAAAFLRQGIAPGAARTADVLEIQAQSLERDAAGYAQLVDAAAAQARSAHPQVVLLAGLSTNPPGATVTAAMLRDAIAATHATVSGYWMNIPGRGPQCPNCNQQRPDLAVATLGGAG